MAEQPSAYVLDSFALLAYLQAEPGGDTVRDLLERAATDQIRLSFSIINAGEVYYLLAREQGVERAEQFLRDLRSLRVELLEASEDRVLSAARLKAQHRIAYADAFAASLAMELRARLVTGDPEFQSIAGSVDILWLVTS